MQINLYEKWFNKLVEKPAWVFLVYLLIGVLLRYCTFFPLVIDHDESTYLVIANEWLKGGIPFKDYIDVKPIGIYAAFAAVIYLFGQSILAIRVFTTLIISITAYFLYKAKRRESNNAKIAWMTGLAYVLILSLHKWGWSGNTEIYFVCFVAIGLYLLIKAKSVVEHLLLGLVMGMGFLFKYHIVFDFLAFGLIVLIRDWQSDKKLGFVKAGMMGFGFLIPFGLCALTYKLSAHWAAFVDASFVIPSRYIFERDWLDSLAFVGEFYLGILPFGLLFFVVLYQKLKKSEARSAMRCLMVIWPLACWIAILFTGKHFFHYYVQAVLPVCYFAFDRSENWSTKWIVWASVILVMGLAVVNQRILKEGNPVVLDQVEQLRIHLLPEAEFYTNGEPVLYYLLDQSPLSPYVHKTLLYDPDHIYAYGIDQNQEFRSILESNPELILSTSPAPKFLKESLNTQYQLLHRFEDGSVLWKKE